MPRASRVDPSLTIIFRLLPETVLPLAPFWISASGRFFFGSPSRRRTREALWLKRLKGNKSVRRCRLGAETEVGREPEPDPVGHLVAMSLPGRSRGPLPSPRSARAPNERFEPGRADHHQRRKIRASPWPRWCQWPGQLLWDVGPARPGSRRPIELDAGGPSVRPSLANRPGPRDTLPDHIAG